MLDRLLRSDAVALLARTLLTLPFWLSGIIKLFDYAGGAAEMARFGLEPASAFNIATILVQLGGSLSIISNRGPWLGAGALAVFTLLTIPLVHHFWSMTEEPFRTIAFHTSTEHVGVIGGLIISALLGARSKRHRF